MLLLKLLERVVIQVTGLWGTDGAAGLSLGAGFPLSPGSATGLRPSPI